MKKIVFALCVVPVALAAARPEPGRGATIEQFLAPGYPTEVVSAKKVDRIAWTAYEHGLRNVYTAVAPEFKPVRLTSFVKDDGVELSDIAISDDGSVVTFVRGTQPNREGWIANPTSAATGAVRTVWAVRLRADGASAGQALNIGEVTMPALSPDGRTVVFSKDGQIFSYRVGAAVHAATVHPAPVHSAPVHPAPRASMNRLRLFVHIVHQDVLPECVGCREVRLALADRGDAPHETDEIVVACEHEGVDHDPGAAAARDFANGLRDNGRIEAK